MARHSLTGTRCGEAVPQLSWPRTDARPRSWRHTSQHTGCCQSSELDGPAYLQSCGPTLRTGWSGLWGESQSPRCSAARRRLHEGMSHVQSHAQQRAAWFSSRVALVGVIQAEIALGWLGQPSSSTPKHSLPVQLALSCLRSQRGSWADMPNSSCSEATPGCARGLQQGRNGNSLPTSSTLPHMASPTSAISHAASSAMSLSTWACSSCPVQNAPAK